MLTTLALLKLRIPVRDAQKPSLLNQTELSWGKTSVKLQTALNPQLLRPKLSNLHQTVHREIQQFSRYYSKLCKFTEVKTLNQLQNCAQRPEIVIQHPEYYLYQHKLVLPFFARLRYRVLTSPSKVKSVIQWVKMPINVQLNSNLLNFVCSCKNFPKMQRNWQTTLLSFSAASGTGVIKRKKGVHVWNGWTHAWLWWCVTMCDGALCGVSRRGTPPWQDNLLRLYHLRRGLRLPVYPELYCVWVRACVRKWFKGGVLEGSCPGNLDSTVLYCTVRYRKLQKRGLLYPYWYERVRSLNKRCSA